MIHIMHLNPNSFDKIKIGNKKVEVRLNDEKRQKIRKGDLIHFYKRGNDSEILITRVINFELFKSLQETYEKLGLGIVGSQGLSIEEAVNNTRQFYGEDDEKKIWSIGYLPGISRSLN